MADLSCCCLAVNLLHQHPPPPPRNPQGEEVKQYRGGRDKDSLKTFITEAAKEVTTESS